MAALSTNVDRHLARLVTTEGWLKKVSQGMYAAPKATAFGEAPPEAYSLLRAFNRKRVGDFTLGGRTYMFHRWREAPKQLPPEFLVVDLLNHLDSLAEDRDQVLLNLRGKLSVFNRRKLRLAASRYGTLSARKKLEELMGPNYSK